MAASSVLIWRLMADCVTDNSSAAWVNDNFRAAASKPRKASSGGRRAAGRLAAGPDFACNLLM